jgi:hypothetical protein
MKNVQANYLEMIQPKLDIKVFGKQWDAIDLEQRNMITVNYPLNQGFSIEDIAKLGNWLFNGRSSDD